MKGRGFFNEFQQKDETETNQKLTLPIYKEDTYYIHTLRLETFSNFFPSL